eukprot:3095549-Amphidinium_carterae.2
MLRSELLASVGLVSACFDANFEKVFLRLLGQSSARTARAAVTPQVKVPNIEPIVGSHQEEAVSDN